MFRRRGYYGNGPSSKGLGIFWLMLVFLPIFSWIFNVLDWLIEHIYLVIALSIGWFFIKVWLTYEEMKEKQKEENK